MFTKLLAIVSITFRETIRQPVFGVLMWVAAGMLVINPGLAQFSLQSGRDNKILQDVGLATLLLFGLLASAFSATGVITREIENRTVLTVISKPVSRVTFLLAKFLGVSGALLVGFYFLTLIFMMTVRHGVMETVSDKFDYPVLVLSLIALGVSLTAAIFGNYVYGWHFSSALTAWVVPLGTVALALVLCFDKTWTPQSPFMDFGNLQVIYGVLGVFLAVLVLTAIAVVISTRFNQVMTMLICSAVFIAALLSDHLVGGPASRGEGMVYTVLYALIPNFQFFWLADALTQDLAIQAQHVWRLAAYAALFIPAILALGVAMFQTREVG
ncbi:MAG: hypothetical protein CHACPFDD_02173 [Phycisphaerae bacterium]|nr:hypothetical protein [Phycisphaerae bacterium]